MLSGGYHSSNREKQVDLVLNDDAGKLERDLILRAQAGESAAFGELVTRYMRRAYFSALGFVGNHEDALDLSQEANFVPPAMGIPGGTGCGQGQGLSWR